MLSTIGVTIARISPCVLMLWSEAGGMVPQLARVADPLQRAGVLQRRLRGTAHRKVRLL